MMDPTERSYLETIPNELYEIITQYLDVASKKSLRLVNNRLLTREALKIFRIFFLGGGYSERTF